MRKDGQNNLYSIQKDFVSPSILSNKNRARSWIYGYDDKYDIVVISKNGQVGQIVNTVSKKKKIPVYTSIQIRITMNTQTTCCHVSNLLTGNHDIFNNSLIKIPRILFLCKKRREVELLAGVYVHKGGVI